MTPPEGRNQAEFAALARGSRQGPVVDLWRLLAQNKKWWLLPIVLMIGLVGAFVVAGGSSLAPILYTLF